MSKGNSVQLSTFLSWKVDEDIGFNSVKKEGKELVVKVWCKSCAKYSDVIRSDSMAERSSEGRCVEVCGGIGLVTKHAVTRHLSGQVSGQFNVESKVDRTRDHSPCFLRLLSCRRIASE